MVWLPKSFFSNYRIVIVDFKEAAFDMIVCKLLVNLTALSVGCSDSKLLLSSELKHV